jgi:hypothetical protein
MQRSMECVRYDNRCAIFVHLRMLWSLFTFRVEQLWGITDEGLND